jgi:hypothetical protein
VVSFFYRCLRNSQNSRFLPAHYNLACLAIKFKYYSEKPFCRVIAKRQRFGGVYRAGD